MAKPKPQFDADGRDIKTYAPFVLTERGEQDFIVQFYDWDWIFSTYSADVVDGSIDGYYMNGPGIEGLVRAAILRSGLDEDALNIFYNSEGNTCFIEFKSLDEAARVAEISAAMINDRTSLLAMIRVARSHGFED